MKQDLLNRYERDSSGRILIDVTAERIENCQMPGLSFDQRGKEAIYVNRKFQSGRDCFYDVPTHSDSVNLNLPS